MPRLLLLVMSAVVVVHADVVAQARGIELQAGIGHVFNAAPSVPAVNPGLIAWLTPRWGIGARLTEGVARDDFDEPTGETLGVGGLRMWTLTSEWRWFGRGTEVNVGLGGGRHEYRYEVTETALPRSDRSGSGFLAMHLLVGRRLHGPLHVKGGFTYGLGWDLHPFQPVAVFAWKP
jgi:hypothetical protein